MIKPTVIVVAPTHVDFPLFRYNLKRFKNYFQDIYIAISNSNREEDYSNFFKSDLPFCNFMYDKMIRPDWRDSAINSVLDETQFSNQITHYLFLEQDFLVKDNSFWDKVLKKDWDFVYYNEGDRIHPAFALVKKDIVESTNQDFSAHPDDYNTDHFGQFFKEVVFNSSDDLTVELTELGLMSKEDFFHVNGVTQNYYLFTLGEPFYKPQEFLAYNYLSTKLPTDPQFLQLEQSIVDKFGQGSNTFLWKFFV